MNKPKLLLHTCCAPCASAIIEHLSKYFEITLYFYNPCITDKKEYYKRVNELFQYVWQVYGDSIEVIAENLHSEDFYEIAKGLENCGERGGRCILCYNQRLDKTAKYAQEHDFDYFSTTLSLSPYKDKRMLNKLGMALETLYGVRYLISDFGYLYPRSLELCKKYMLYQQEYCGCEYSKNYSQDNVIDNFV